MFFLRFISEILPQISDFVKFDDYIEKKHQNLLDYNQILFKKRFKVNKKTDFLLRRNEKIQVIVSMIMLTRSSERIFNPMRYTGLYLSSARVQNCRQLLVLPWKIEQLDKPSS